MQAVIHSHSQWQPLKEVWIGGTYPEHFYRHLGSKSHDLFSKITEITQKDFDNLEKILQGLGVKVQRPKFDRIDDFLDENDNLLKPPISPCDFALTLGDSLYINPQYPTGVDPYQHAIDEYQANGQDVYVIDRSSDDPWAWVSFPSVVKVGRDIFMDYSPAFETGSRAVAQQLSKNYRVHLSNTGDHSDGVFCPIKDKHIFTSHYRTKYQQSFPDWKIFCLPNTTHKNVRHLGLNKKWWLPGVDYAYFNSQVIDVAEAWLGHPIETVFEVNMLAVDEQNIICGAYDEQAWKYFESIGVTPHLADFQSRLFWDAGIHCVTSDIHRIGPCVDYWPNRGENGIYQITEWS